MSWGEVKKINSNLDVPLNELIERPNFINYLSFTESIQPSILTQKDILNVQSDKGGYFYGLQRYSKSIKAGNTLSAHISVFIDGSHIFTLNEAITNSNSSGTIHTTNELVLPNDCYKFVNFAGTNYIVADGFPTTILCSQASYFFQSVLKKGDTINTSTLGSSYFYLRKFNRPLPFKKSLKVTLTVSPVTTTTGNIEQTQIAYSLND